MLTSIRYIKVHVDFTFGPPDYVRYIEEFVISMFVISRFYSIHFTVTLAGMQNTVCYIQHLLTGLLWLNMFKYYYLIIIL